MTERLEKAVFAENLNTKFILRPDDEHVVELELTNIKEIESAPGQEQFALHFRGPGNVYLPQRIYPLEHERMGAISLFLVPTGRDENGYIYEAAFNRFIK
ncbi:MAG: hypothetical protein WCB68_13270 [Pyrinomonadaceae bacterium]